MKIKRIFIIPIGFLIVFSFVFLYFKSSKVRAEMALFYPQSCLGSFSNPEKAKGEPEVNSQEEINEYNSAVYYGGFKEIYCGDFKGPVSEGEIQKIILKLNAVLTQELIQKPVIEIEGQGILENIIPSKTIEIINTSTEKNLPNSSSSSFFHILKFALAQEEQTTLVTETNTDPSLIPETTNSTETPKTLENSIETTTQETNTSTETITTTEVIRESLSSTPHQPLFEIFYTLDGSNWNYLGSIYENTSDFSFEIPIKDWVDISKIQIKINSLPDTNYYFYLESMSLEVEYLVKKENLETNDILLKEESNDVPLNEEATKHTALISEVINLKERKINKNIEIKNPDNISCFFEPFSLEIKEGETKSVKLHLISQSLKNLEIGDLPPGIDLNFEGGNYELTISDKILNLTLTRLPNSQKGNFSLPVVFSSQNSTIICQINVQAF